MTRRLFLVAAAAAFLGWLGWLAYAVSKAGTVPIVSRAQLTEATDIVVADLTEDPDDPSKPARSLLVTDVVTGDNLKSGDRLADVDKLGSARPPGTKGFPGAGKYLVPLKKIGNGFQVAGLPRSPGYEAQPPVLPLVYPWIESVKIQLRSLGLLK